MLFLTHLSFVRFFSLFFCWGRGGAISPTIYFVRFFDMYWLPVSSEGIWVKQIGQSSSGGGCLNNSSSCNSAERFLHGFLCCGRWAIWHSRLQYFTILHAVHDLRSSPSLPQFAHIDTFSFSVAVLSVLSSDMFISSIDTSNVLSSLYNSTTTKYLNLLQYTITIRKGRRGAYLDIRRK